MVTAGPGFEGLDLVEPGDLVLGGTDIRSHTLAEAAGRLADEGVIAQSLVEGAAGFLEETETRIVDGFPTAADPHFEDLAPGARANAALSAGEQVDAHLAAIGSFREEHALERVVVVHLASTEKAIDVPGSWETARGLEAAIAAGEEIPTSVLTALAAIRAGAAFVNFTPAPGALVGGVADAAEQAALPFCGNDGKTGETLVKSALAPMFRDRNLRVLSWEGVNMLGNTDGEVLADPEHRASKERTKDRAVRQVLGDEDVHTGVAIHYVPSLGDWKTAWDLIHFEGFLGTKMGLDFTWRGSDSALAAPLVLDLVRLADHALRRGESGAMRHTAAFFKSPLGVEEQDFFRQMARLRAYADGA